MKPIEGLKKSAPKKVEMISVPAHDIFQPGSQGPFKCGHCEHFTAPNTCNQPYIVKLRGSEVDEDDCCDLYESIGE